MKVNLWYDNIIYNQFLNNFIPREIIQDYVKNPYDTFQHMKPYRTNSVIPDYFRKTFYSKNINYNSAAAFQYCKDTQSTDRNYVPFEPWFFKGDYTLDVSNSVVKNILKNDKNIEILVWYPDEGFHSDKTIDFLNILHSHFPDNKIRFVYGNLKKPKWTKELDWLIYRPFDGWWFKTAKNINFTIELNKDKKANKAFSFYNRRFRIPRAVLFKDLIDSNLLTHADYTYHSFNAEKNMSVSKFIENYLYWTKNTPHEELRALIKSKKFITFAQNHMQGETVETANSQLYDKDFFYTQSFLDLVTETIVHDEDDNLFITEKTYRSIVSGNIFLIVGQPGILAHLKSFGIKTFDDIFDESYDATWHWYERWKIIKQNLVKWINLGPTKQEQYYKDNFESKIVHNRNIILNRNFKNNIIDLFDEDTGFF